MSEYLSKEEIKQWRSSLEKITLEEYAARLGKKIEESKPSHDLADIVLKGKPVTDEESTRIITRTERLSAIAERAMSREKEISTTPFTIKNIEKIIEADNKAEKAPAKKKVTAKKAKETTKTTAKTTAKTKVKAKTSAKTKTSVTMAKAEKTVKKAATLRDEVHIVFKKALTDREQKVFNYFSKNKDKVVFAKDLATLLDLPKDYVYKYIKNIRSKIEGAELQNAERGGFMFSTK